VNFNLDNSGEWITLSDGSKIWRLSISCSEAKSINLLYDKFWIPAGAKFFVYSNDKKRTLGAFTSENNRGDLNNLRGFTTGLIFSNQVTLEYYLPEEVKEVGVISITYVVQGYRFFSSGYGESMYCNININCPEGAAWQNEKNAIALILLDGFRICSGSLVNTTENDNRPYFLTADHCLGWTEGGEEVKYDAQWNPNAELFSFIWHYESPECEDTYDPPYIETSRATVIANNFVSDFALLALDENPAKIPGITPYYLGWDCSGDAGTSGVAIHHPMGDIKKIALTRDIHNYQYYLPWGSPANSHWECGFYAGYLEKGSSGAPLLNNNRRVIGHHCGSRFRENYCYYLYHVIDTLLLKCYGKFWVSWDRAAAGFGWTNSKERLRDWLDPNNTGITTLDGTDCNLKLKDKTYSSGTYSIEGCSIEISNSTIDTNTTVNLHGHDFVKVKTGFHAVSGSNVRITAGSSKHSKNGNKDKITFTDLNSKNIAKSNIEIIENHLDFTLYPNPNPGSFKIDANFPLTEISNLKISNLLGVTIYEAQNLISNNIQLSSSVSGIVFVIIILRDGTLLTQKMLIQR